MALSATEVKIIASVCFAQDMLRIMSIFNALGILVYLTMTLRVDNSGDVNISKNWISNGRNRHIYKRLYFLGYLK